MKRPSIYRRGFGPGLVLLVLLVVGCGAWGQTDRGNPVDRVRTGDYDAVAALEDLVEGGNLAADVVESLYYGWTRRGEYELGRERFESFAQTYPGSAPVRLAAARVNRKTGMYERALEHLDAARGPSPVSAAVLFERAGLLEDVGRREESVDTYEELLELYLDGGIEGLDLVYAAQTMGELEYDADANELFQLLAERNPRSADLFLAWADFLSERYQYEEAVPSYEDALAINPDLPEAHVGIARLPSYEDPQRSAQALERALEINPNLVEAHLLQASYKIDAEQYDEADEETAKALEVNPHSAPALSMLAATSFLRGEESEFDDYVRRVLEANPRYGELYYILADRCVSVRLYAEAVEFAREAVRLNPRYWDAYTLLGINLLRIGEEEEATAVLENVYENNRYNPLTVNTLRLTDSWENFDRIETEHFEVLLNKDERAVLEPYVTELLEEAYDTLSAKYRFEPEWPIVFEMYPHHEDFEVRTLGLPGLSALGVAFGKVMVMDSASAREPESFNWGSTLWHEFAHIVTLQMTDHKIPRWFSEGLSVYEERKAVPGWGDDLKLDFLMAIKDDQFLPISELNNGFVRPTHPGQVSLSYYQASLVCDYIELQYGFERILEMLALYREGRSTEEVFQQALGLSEEAFDRGFLVWVEQKTSAIDVDAFRSQVQEGYAAFEAGDLDVAVEKLTEAIEAYPEYSDAQNPYEVLAEIYVERGEPDRAIEVLEAFVSYSEVAHSTYLKLAGLMKESGDLEGAARILERSVYIHPMDLEGHREYGSVLLERERFAEAAREYRTLLALNTPDAANAYFNLASAQYGAGDLSGARTSVLRSLEIAPSFEAAQELLLRIVR